MQSGFGYHFDSPSDGSMALFCPACPQPGINLPEDWKDRYTEYVLISIPSELFLIQGILKK